MNDIVYGVKLTADGKQLVGEVRSSRAEFDALNASAQRVNATSRQLNLSQGELSAKLKASAEYTAAYKARVEETRAAQERAAEQLYQVNDAYLKAKDGADKSAFATAGARRELMVIGREIVSGDFSRVPGSMMVLASRTGATALALTPLTTGFAAVAASAAGVMYAMHKGREEMNAMNDALAVTNGYAGLTRGGMEALAHSVAQGGQVTIGTSKDIVTALVASGRIGSDAIGTVARMTKDYARATGADIEKITPEMVKLFSDPARGAEELNKSMHFLTATDLEHIATLERLGRVQEAQLFLSRKFADHLPKEAENVGIVTEAYRGWASAISGVADWMMNLGKTDSIEAQIQRKQEEIARLQNGGSRDAIALRKVELMALMDLYVEKQKDLKASKDAADFNDKQIAAMKEIGALSKQAKAQAIADRMAMIGGYLPTDDAHEAMKNEALRALRKEREELLKPPKVATFDHEGSVQDAIDAAGRKRRLKEGEEYNAAYVGAVEAANRAIDKARGTSEEYAEQLGFENSLIGKSALEVQRLTEKRRIELQLEKDLMALRNDSRFKTRDSNPDVEAQYQRAVDGAREAGEAMRAGADVEITARYEASRAWDTGGTKAIRTYLDEAGNAAKQSERMYGDAFRAMDDAGVQFVRHQKINFEGLIDGMINNLIRLQWQQHVTMPLVGSPGSPGLVSQGLSWAASAMGFGSPASSGSSPEMGFENAFGGERASGGPVGANSLYRVNELGPEVLSYDGEDYLMMGGRGGFVKPLSAPVAVGAGAAPSVTVNVINAPGTTAQVQQRPDGNGGMTLDVIIEQIEGGIARNVSRGTGALNGALTQTFGLNRAPGAY